MLKMLLLSLLILLTLVPSTFISNTDFPLITNAHEHLHLYLMFDVLNMFNPFGYAFMAPIEYEQLITRVVNSKL